MVHLITFYNHNLAVTLFSTKNKPEHWISCGAYEGEGLDRASLYFQSEEVIIRTEVCHRYLQRMKQEWLWSFLAIQALLLNCELSARHKQTRNLQKNLFHTKTIRWNSGKISLWRCEVRNMKTLYDADVLQSSQDQLKKQRKWLECLPRLKVIITTSLQLSWHTKRKVQHS